MHLIRQKGRLTWQVRWWKDGVRHQTSTGTADRLAAERVMLTMREAVERGADSRRVERLLRAIYDDSHMDRIALADCVGEYLRIEGTTQRTKLVSSHWGRFVRWCEARPGLTALADVTPGTCREFASSLTGVPKTVAHIVSNCARLYRVVAPLHGLDGDPWRGIRMSAKSRQGRALTPAETAALLKATSGTEYGLAILIGLYTGLRYSDIARLRWDAIDGDTIRMVPHKTASHGVEVVIPLHGRVVKALPARCGEYVMPELARTYRWRKTADRFKLACEAAGVSHEGITFHSLRHTFVTRLAEAGIPEDIRRRLAGHSNAVTHDRYTHDEAAQRAAIDAL